MVAPTLRCEAQYASTDSSRGDTTLAFWLAKLAPRFILPLGLSLALVAVGVALLATRHRRLGLLSAGLGVGWLWLCSTPAISNQAKAALERIHLPVALEAMPSGDAIVVLGGAIGPVAPPRLTSDLGAGADRILHAARLYRAGKAPVVIVSGGILPTLDVGVPQAAGMADLLREWGVPEAALLLEARSRNTRENCLGVKSMLDERGIDRVLLVTSALHMRRALAACRSVGISALPAPTDFEVVDAPATVLDWIPEATALARSTQVLWELLGYQVYRWRGWIREFPEASANG